MSKPICIPCLNLIYNPNYDLVFHRWSKAKCNACGKSRQGLIVSIVKARKEE